MAILTKTPVREAIEAEVIACLRHADRPLSANDIYAYCETAEDKPQVVRIIGYMREAGSIIRDEDIPVGAPGGMTAKSKGARALASYRLPTEAECAAIEAVATEAAYSAQETVSAASAETKPLPQAIVQDSLTVAQSASATREEDPADYLDTAASSANGDESASPWARMLAEDCTEDHQWESDLLQACETSREALLTIADQLLAGHPVWSAARAVDRALTRLADEYV
jgi:hypothetical protein